ncbi:menaquinone-dependent protoporphyrinogen IX dehydrogenase [Candidatus Pantoea edessiphila]|uniref:Protoporphyrinogen IX dehydrogenase [quinone] n=1 Tax=Candidatus Pantoea edessiphila TaxID=2044610 RepID=A0A2P5T1B6_9GAMM|nr:menaquinone-dependent protoporphyrinogen IX dehydrogenase [Candidatus Pantoea edessiphila]PPI88368.1 menaquinone-dependent protoporphyrinogen IX dehydrogenase [Candidatus Pantoea edessiphila]
MKALIIFYSRNGQTEKISSYIADIIRSNQPCDLINISDAINIDFDWKQYDCILIGASIHYGHFHPIVNEFIKRNVLTLKEIFSGFFSVNLVARKIEKSSPYTNAYTYKFLNSSPWKPNCCAVFGGALKYSRYNLFDKTIIRFIMFITGGETNINYDVEYTNWEQVKKFANHFKNLKLKKLIN